jgi:phenylalanyl-tRNA synthetase alpha chain
MDITDIEKKIRGQLDCFLSEIDSISDPDELYRLKTRYVGAKSFIILTLGNIKDLPPQMRPVVGRDANNAKKRMEQLLEEKEKHLKGVLLDRELHNEKIDLSLPGTLLKTGKKHIVTQVIEEIEDIFTGMGFIVAEGPEVETDYYNFEALNTPADHPARSLHDTFFVSEKILLRTQTSSVQIRYMEEHQPPIYIISPGKVYRKDYDISHTPMFTQIEGLVVDKGINFTNLKWMLETFVHKIFGSERKIRFRPHYFPFTEPSAEVDVSCNICGGRGCRTCGGSGWLEILGAGMVDPNLYKFVNYDEKGVSGFAFGMGIERVCMLRYGINDIRLFYENDLRFIGQF